MFNALNARDSRVTALFVGFACASIATIMLHHAITSVRLIAKIIQSFVFVSLIPVTIERACSGNVNFSSWIFFDWDVDPDDESPLAYVISVRFLTILAYLVVTCLLYSIFWLSVCFAKTWSPRDPTPTTSKSEALKRD